MPTTWHFGKLMNDWGDFKSPGMNFKYDVQETSNYLDIFDKMFKSILTENVLGIFSSYNRTSEQASGGADLFILNS